MGLRHLSYIIRKRSAGENRPERFNLLVINTNIFFAPVIIISAAMLCTLTIDPRRKAYSLGKARRDPDVVSVPTGWICGKVGTDSGLADRIVTSLA